jgi:hypothetical protein
MLETGRNPKIRRIPDAGGGILTANAGPLRLGRRHAPMPANSVAFPTVDNGSDFAVSRRRLLPTRATKLFT